MLVVRLSIYRSLYAVNIFGPKSQETFDDISHKELKAVFCASTSRNFARSDERDRFKLFMHITPSVLLRYIFIIVVISAFFFISSRCNMWVRGFIVGVIISSILQFASSKPFLHNALFTLASSASSGSSSPSARLTNIADYTRRQEKVQELENEKQITNTDIVNPIDSSEKTDNEATPSLIRKKLSKFLSKIQFLSSLSRSPADVEETTESAATPAGEVKIEFDEPGEHIQKLTASRKEYGIPLRIHLEINEVAGNSTEAGDDLEAAGSEERSARVGQLGVFFAELLGSLVGLVNGAYAHINTAVQGNGELETAI